MAKNVEDAVLEKGREEQENIQPIDYDKIICRLENEHVPESVKQELESVPKRVKRGGSSNDRKKVYYGYFYLNFC